MALSLEQQQLLIDLVDAERRPPVRQQFVVVKFLGDMGGVRLAHQGWLNQDRLVFEGDIDELESLGLLRRTRYPHESFSVSNAGRDEAARIMRARGTAIERAASLPLQYLNGPDFVRRHAEVIRQVGER